MRYQYNRPDTMGPDDSYEFSCNFSEDDGDWIAENAAEDYHRKHDGWEAAWPIVLIVQREDGSEIGTYEVEREYEPVFNAREVKK